MGRTEDCALRSLALPVTSPDMAGSGNPAYITC